MKAGYVFIAINFGDFLRKFYHKTSLVAGATVLIFLIKPHWSEKLDLIFKKHFNQFQH